MILALESSTAEIGVALADGAGLLAACTVRADRRHVETVHPAIEHVCSLAGVTPRDLDAVAVDVGPGMLTAVRVGVAAAKGIALACGVPTVPCTSLDVLAHAARAAGRVVPVVDLRRGEVAWDIGAGAGGRSGARAGTPSELAADLAALGVPVLLVGDGAHRHGDAVVAAARALHAPEPRVERDDLAAPPVAALAALALARLARGTTASALEVAALYLRPPDARANFTSRAAPPVAHGAGAG
ncbi:MAG TPA: tRNA (adenosine(37)-N6)-threonylcarbamoyltransferase complex dimerization subunit type 1 TsaB [Acidimicrobiales bacterium]|nr:tRNA (adenosine(37)-N6)-threonylcarbamoyltransferase complex dimerization subunit type 1 TsaB [Acidimicrobiales bacterium]